MNNMVFDENLTKEMIRYLAEEKKVELSLDEDDYDDQAAVKDIVLGALECVANKLAEEKSKTEEVSINLDDYMTLTVNFREGNGDGNYNLSITAGPELKKRIKDDADAEEDDE